jgi:hypothetical protein
MVTVSRRSRRDEYLQIHGLEHCGSKFDDMMIRGYIEPWLPLALWPIDPLVAGFPD